MEVSLLFAMFQCSFEKYGLRYPNYIGDGYSKTYSEDLNAKPHGNNFIVNKKIALDIWKKGWASA